MMVILLFAAISSVTTGGVVVGGIIVLAFVWEKIRPVIVIKTEKGSSVYLAITHSKKRKNVFPLTQEGISGIEVDENTCYGLSNAPSKMLNEIGSITPEKAQELLDTIDEKKIDKIDKRSKLK